MKDQALVLAVQNASVEAWNRGDLPGHLAIYDESVTCMTQTGPRPGIAPIAAAFGATYFKGDRPTPHLRMEQIVLRALGNDSALMTGRYVLQGAGESEQSGWFTLIWRRTDSGWKVVHDHAN